MISVGGESYSNGICFNGDKYKVNFKTFQNETKISLKKYNKSVTKLSNFLSKIPFLRGLNLFLGPCKLLIPIFVLNIVSNTTMVNDQKELSKHFSKATIIICFIVSLLLLRKAKSSFGDLKKTWSYHGAEHKVIYTNYENKEINLENCRNSPRISDNCGTMFVAIYFVIFLATKTAKSLFFKNMYSSIYFLITFSLAYELFLLKRDTPVLRYIFKFGYAFQKYVVTREPSDFQLNQAIEAFKLLERAETGNIPEDELNNLLKNGKVLFNI